MKPATMRTLLISLISEQTLPNVQFIREFSGRTQDYLFLNTEKYQKEGRVNWIRSAAGIQDRLCLEAIIDPENPSRSIAALEDIEWNQWSNIIINLTGGTKMMALAVYAFFSARTAQDVEIYYIPVFGNSLIRIFPDNDRHAMNISIDLRTYLTAYGIHILHENNLHQDPDAVALAQHIYDGVIQKGDSALIERIKSCHQIISEKERKIYGGEWLEIWLANRIVEVLGVPPEAVLQGVRLNKFGMSNSTFNELDVLFLKGNRLFIGECKFYNQGRFKAAAAGRDTFKLGNLGRSLGLHATPFFVTANDTSISPQFPQMCEFHGVNHVLDFFTLRSDMDFANYLKTKLT
jgi:hypothetical protein